MKYILLSSSILVSLSSEPVGGPSNRPLSPCEPPHRGKTEFSRQSRVFRSIPQRLLVKHSKPTIRPTHISIPSPVGRSLTPIPVHKTIELEKAPQLDRTRSLTQEEMPVVKAPGEERKPSPRVSRSVLQQQHMEWRRAMLEVAVESGGNGGGESKSGETKSSIHGDLYDTLFTLQTLNGKSGVEDLLARVRTVYEARSAMGTSTIIPKVCTENTPCSRDQKTGKSTSHCE